MSEDNGIELATLAGKHMLSGVDETSINVDRYDNGNFEDCNCINFILDGVTYSAIEDPNDGYRSSMDKLFVNAVSVKNCWSPIEVTAVHRNKGSWGDEDDVLELYDAVNGKLILEVGTSSIDDYYPSFVASFTPENMSINEGLK